MYRNEDGNFSVHQQSARQNIKLA